MTTQIEQAMREDIEQPVVDERRHQAPGRRQLDTIVNKIGYPDRWRDYSAVEVMSATIISGQRAARHGL